MQRRDLRPTHTECRPPQTVLHVQHRLQHHGVGHTKLYKLLLNTTRHACIQCCGREGQCRGHVFDTWVPSGRSLRTSQVTTPLPSASMRLMSCSTLSSNAVEAWSTEGVRVASSRRTSPVSITLLPSLSTYWHGGMQTKHTRDPHTMHPPPAWQKHYPPTTTHHSKSEPS